MNYLMRLIYASFLMFALVVLLAPLSHAATVMTPAMKVTIGGQRAKFASVYFVRAKAPLIAIEARQLNVIEVKAKMTSQVGESPIDVPSVSVNKAGIFAAFNYVIIVLHDQPQFVWLNADETIPPGETQNGTARARQVTSYDLNDLASLPKDEAGTILIHL